MTPLHDLDEAPLGVLIAGAGVGGLETLVALRGLAPQEVAPTLIAPDETFSFRALSVFEPFGYEPLSPEAAKMDWPWAAICRKIGSSLPGSAGPQPHEMLIAFEMLSVAMRLKMSTSECPM